MGDEDMGDFHFVTNTFDTQDRSGISEATAPGSRDLTNFLADAARAQSSRLESIAAPILCAKARS